MSQSSGPPPWVVTWGTVLVVALTGFHIVFDALNTAYSNSNLSLALLAATCLALGIKKTFRDGDDGR